LGRRDQSEAAYTSPAQQWINAISALGVASSSQPAASDISGLGTAAVTAATAYDVGGPLQRLSHRRRRTPAMRIT
jgi:hypothetical protein